MTPADIGRHVGESHFLPHLHLIHMPTGHVNKLDPQFFLNYSPNINHRPLKRFEIPTGKGHTGNFPTWFGSMLPYVTY